MLNVGRLGRWGAGGLGDLVSCVQVVWMEVRVRVEVMMRVAEGEAGRRHLQDTAHHATDSEVILSSTFRVTQGRHDVLQTLELLSISTAIWMQDQSPSTGYARVISLLARVMPDPELLIV